MHLARLLAAALGGLLLACTADAGAETVAATLSVYAGTGVFASGPDGVPAVGSALSEPGGLVRRGGDVLIYDCGRVRAVDGAGVVRTVAGSDLWHFAGDGGPAVGAGFAWPCNTGAIGGLAVTGTGDLLIADGVDHRVRLVDRAGTIRTLAGTGAPAFAGDGGPAPGAALYEPSGIAVDHRGNVFVADTVNHRVRRIDPAGTITTFVGGATRSGCAVCPQATGVKATDADLWSPVGLAVDAHDNLYVTDGIDDRVLEVTPDGVLAAVIGRPHAGSAAGFSGDGGPAAAAELDSPLGVAVAPDGTVLIADTGNARIRAVDAAGTIRTVAGGGTLPAQAGVPATSALLVTPVAVMADAGGDLYISVRGRVLKSSTPRPVAASEALPLPSAKTCTSRRAFPIRVRRLRGIAYTSATVAIDGRRVPVYVYVEGRTRVRTIGAAALSDRRFRAFVDLRGRVRGTYAVQVTATTADGRTLRATRRYRTCHGALRGGLPRL